MKILNKLRQLGVSDTRARFYLAALELGEASVTTVAKTAGIGRTHAYDILNSLVDEGLLNQIEKSNRTVVVAEDPDRLLQRAHERVSQAQEILPELQAIYTHSLSKPRIRYYSGLDGIINVMNDTLNCQSKELWGILSMVELLNVPGKTFMREHIKRRVEAGIHLKVIRSKQEDIEVIWPTSKSELRELRFFQSDLPLTMTSYIYDDTVAYISSRKENFAMIIQSAEFAGLKKALYSTMWQASIPESGV